MLAYLIALLAILALIYYWLSKDLNYFDDKPFPSLPSKLLIGSSGEMLLRKYSISDYVKKLYDQFQHAKVFGFHDLNLRIFAIRDPQLIKQLTIKDFDYFTDHRGPIQNTSDSPHVLFPKTLFMLTDQKWRDMRATLSPAFTGSKMRQMFDLVVECTKNMVQFYKEETSGGSKVYEMKDLFSRVTNDIIATCAFGLKVDSRKDRDNEFFTNGKKAMDLQRFSILLRIIAYRYLPKLMSWLEVDVIDREQNDFFSSIIREAVKNREVNGIVRHDMINLLMQARKGTLKFQHEKSHSEGFAVVEESDVGQRVPAAKMTEPEFVAQCLIFFLAGFDTVSTCLTFLSYELAVNPEIQQTLYQEVLSFENSLSGKSLTYDDIQKLKYLDQCVSEALRKWPPLGVSDRVCAKDYHVDDGEGLRFTIEKGSCIWIPVHGLHRDPKFYPDPERFNPDRFSEENRTGIVPGTYLPFGIGPRNCIGSRFALMKVKTIVYYLLLEYSFERVAETQVPLKLAKTFQGLNAESGVYIGFTPR